MNKFLGFLFLCFPISWVSAQVGNVSPYSQFGIGDLQFHGQINQIGMGGIGVALNDSLQINLANPASYGAIKVTLFDAGMNVSLTKLSTINKYTNKTDAAFNYFALGFPLKRGGGLGACFGLLPYSTRGYAVNYNQLDIEGDKVTHYFEGSGGLNRFFAGAGINLWRNFSAGANASYVFGSLSKVRRTEFADNTFLFTRNTVNSSIADFMFDGGLYYKTDSLIKINTKKRDLKNPGPDTLPNYIYKHKHIRFSVGASSVLGRNLKDKRDYLIDTYYTDPLGTVYVVDTALYVPATKGYTTLPALYRAGFMVQDVNHWLFSVEYQTQDWRKFKSGVVDDNLQPSNTISAGFEFIPKYNSVNYGQRIAFRLGVRYNQTMFNLRNTSLNDKVISIGVGLPVRRDAVTAPYAASFSRINIALELGQRGTTKNDLILEQYIRLHVGVSLSELWFLQRKYD